MSYVKWKYKDHTGEEREFDVFAGDMVASRKLIAIESKYKSAKTTDEVVSLFDEIVEWIDFVLGENAVDTLLGRHYGLEQLIPLFHSLSGFVIKKLQEVNEKYSSTNVVVPDDKPARKSSARKR